MCVCLITIVNFAARLVNSCLIKSPRLKCVASYEPLGEPNSPETVISTSMDGEEATSCYP